MNKCVKIEAPNKISINEIPMPVPRDNEALLQVLYSGICGTDLSSYRGRFAYASYPRIPGHEFSARIIEIKDNDKDLNKGMIVTANPYFNCGKCYSCRRGLANCCENNQTMGVQRDGAMAQYITMPINRIVCGHGINANNLALIEPFCISYHGIKRARIQKGENVLVVGSGTIGILAAVAAKRLGAHVYLCDILQGKLDYAKKFGIEDAFMNDEVNSIENMVKQITNGDGFDVTIEAVGLPETFQNCIDATAYGGRVALIGVSNKSLDFEFNLLQKKELSILGSRNASTEDFIEVINIVKDSKINLQKLVTQEYSFEQAQKAFDDYDNDIGKILKILLKF